MSTVEKTNPADLKINLDPNFSAVIFDFDGTLANSFDFILDVFYREVLRKIPDIRHQTVLRITQTILEKEILEKMKNPKTLMLRVFYKCCRVLDLSRSASSYISLRSARTIQKQYNQIELFPSAEELLQKLNEKGIPAILITLSSKKRVLQILKRHRIDQCFQIIIDKHDMGDVDKGKSIVNALEALGIDKDEMADAIVLGDLPTDIRDGKSVGTKTGAILTGPVKSNLLFDSDPDYVFQDLSEFLSIYRN